MSINPPEEYRQHHSTGTHHDGLITVVVGGIFRMKLTAIRIGGVRTVSNALASCFHKHLGRGDCLLLAGSGNRLAFLSVLC